MRNCITVLAVFIVAGIALANGAQQYVNVVISGTGSVYYPLGVPLS